MVRSWERTASDRGRAGMPKDRIQYVIDAARPFRELDLIVKHVAEARVDRMSAKDIKRLSDLYMTIDRRGDADAVSTWFYAPEGRPIHQDEDRRTVFRLYTMFAILEERGVEPFASGRVRLDSPEPARDWGQLPPDLRYLVAPAERYGHLSSHDEINEAVERLTAEESEELAALGRRVTEDYRKIRTWEAPRPYSKSPEAWRLRNLQLLLLRSGLMKPVKLKSFAWREPRVDPMSTLPEDPVFRGALAKIRKTRHMIGLCELIGFDYTAALSKAAEVPDPAVAIEPLERYRADRTTANAAAARAAIVGYVKTLPADTRAIEAWEASFRTRPMSEFLDD
jgi:hypothetical protein